MLHPETSNTERAGVPLTDASQVENREKWLLMYRQMLTIHIFEEHVNELYLTAKMPGLAHLYSGEEAVAVGVCATLRHNDYEGVS